VLRAQRDLYANMNNQVLHLANQGVTINQIHNVYQVPKGLQEKWYCRGYHGSPQHNARGVIQRYLGFWDCNPTTLIPLSPADSAPLYVEMMGGAAKVLARGRELHDAGKYLLAERDADTLVDNSMHATCNPGGAGKWRPEYCEMLRGADVVIVPDNDEPGRRHAEEVAAALHGIARRVRVLDLAVLWPECPEKGDVSDWLQNHTAADLEAFADKLPDWKSPVSTLPKFLWLIANDLEEQSAALVGVVVGVDDPAEYLGCYGVSMRRRTGLDWC
jgi:hypothetical protein